MTAPMELVDYQAHGHQLPAEVLAQLKYDGVRALVAVDGGRVTLTSRHGNPFDASAFQWLAPHLPAGWVLDCELYRHGAPLEQIAGEVRRGDLAALQLVAFDVQGAGVFADRYQQVSDLAERLADPRLVRAGARRVPVDMAGALVGFARSRGYEGAVLRDPAGLYVPGRSTGAQKLKPELTAEFLIAGIEPTACGASWRCVTASGREFRVKGYSGHGQPGQWLTVRHSSLTGHGVPREAAAVAVRDYE